MAGQLMDEIQEICTGLFVFSCEQLHQLTRIRLTAGAYGSNLIGKRAHSETCYSVC